MLLGVFQYNVIKNLLEQRNLIENIKVTTETLRRMVKTRAYLISKPARQTIYRILIDK